MRVEIGIFIFFDLVFAKGGKKTMNKTPIYKSAYKFTSIVDAAYNRIHKLSCLANSTRIMINGFFENQSVTERVV